MIGPVCEICATFRFQSHPNAATKVSIGRNRVLVSAGYSINSAHVRVEGAGSFPGAGERDQSLSINCPEGQIDPRSTWPGLLHDAMPPVVLRAPFHEKQGSCRERYAICAKVAALFMFEYEVAGRAEGQGRYRGLRAKLPLVIAMKAHAVLVIPVEIQQHAIECQPGCLLDCLPERQQQAGPG